MTETKETILYGCKIGQPQYMEQIICIQQGQVKPELFERAKAWAIAQGYDRFRVHTVNLQELPDFIGTINVK